jgi:diacylglycerol kinase (ATP)
MADVQAQSPFKGKTGVSRLIQAFFNSLAGIADAWRQESAFRQELLLAAILIPLACRLRITAVERALLIAAVLFVLVVELLNSSVEAAVDRISLERHSLSRQAKDLGSAAVLVALCLLALVWSLVVADHWPQLF